MTELSEPTGTPTARDRRDAAIAVVLARAYREGEIPATDALRILRHEMRTRNTNKTLVIRPRSVAAQAVIDRYAAAGQAVPKNSSDEALHADHVWAISARHLETLVSIDDWLRELPKLRAVVCVTAEENYRLEQLEKAGLQGEEKYRKAGIDWADDATG